MNPLRMNCGRYQSRTCWKEEGALSYSAAAALSQQTKAAVAAVTRTTQWGTTRLFHHNERRRRCVSFSVVKSKGASITHAAETALQKSNHAFFGWWAGNRYLNRTELLGTNGSFGIEEGPQTEVEKGPACLSEQRRNLQSLEKDLGHCKNVLLQRWKP